MAFLGRLGDLIVLNLVWAVCCIPVVTIGASTTAMNAVAQQLAREECSSVLKSFFRAFRRDWKQGTCLYLLLLAAAGVAFIDVYYLLQAAYPALLTVVCMLPPVALVFAASYAFPLLARFDNTVFGTLKNALLLSVANLPLSLCLSALNLIPAALFLLLPRVAVYTCSVWVFFGSATICYGNTLLLKRTFARLEGEKAADAADDCTVEDGQKSLR